MINIPITHGVYTDIGIGWIMSSPSMGGGGNMRSDYYGTADWSFTPTSTPVPIPATVWLLGSGLLGFIGIKRKLRK